MRIDKEEKIIYLPAGITEQEVKNNQEVMSYVKQGYILQYSLI